MPSQQSATQLPLKTKKTTTTISTTKLNTIDELFLRNYEPSLSNFNAEANRIRSDELASSTSNLQSSIRIKNIYIYIYIYLNHELFGDDFVRHSIERDGF
jgi:hypothetical protein